MILQALSGRYADGLGQVQNEPQRSGFDPMPWYSMATWMLTQMKRWGYVKTDVNYSALAEQVFLLTDARRQMAALGMAEAEAQPASGYKPFEVMGRPYDPTDPDDYLAGFDIRHA